MNVNQLGPAFSFALFLTGCWIGWRSAQLKEGEARIPAGGLRLVHAFGLGHGAPRPFRVGAVAFVAAVAGFLLGFLSWQLNYSIVLSYVSIAIVACSIGVGWGAWIRGSIEGWSIMK